MNQITKNLAIVIFGLGCLDTSVHAATTWTSIFKDKNIEIQLDNGSLLTPQGTINVWAKNITQTKIVYMQYEVQCKPQKRFNIIAVNAKERKNNKDVPIRLAAKKTSLHTAPHNSPAESVVNAVCGTGKSKAQ